MGIISQFYRGFSNVHSTQRIKSKMREEGGLTIMQKEWQDICAFGRKNNFWRNFAGFLLLLPTWKYTLIIVNLGVGGIVAPKLQSIMSAGNVNTCKTTGWKQTGCDRVDRQHSHMTFCLDNFPPKESINNHIDDVVLSPYDVLWSLDFPITHSLFIYKCMANQVAAG